MRLFFNQQAALFSNRKHRQEKKPHIIFKGAGARREGGLHKQGNYIHIHIQNDGKCVSFFYEDQLLLLKCVRLSLF